MQIAPEAKSLNNKKETEKKEKIKVCNVHCVVALLLRIYTSQ